MPLPKPLRPAFALLAACGACEITHAAEWLAQPSAWWYFDYDSNRRLAPASQGEPSSDAGFMTLDLLLRRLTETDELAIHPQVELQRFTQDTALDSNNGSLQLSASHQAPLWSVASKAGYSRDSTLITELASTGIIDAGARQEALTGELSGTRKLSPRQSVSADVSYVDITYPGGRSAGLIGYHDPSATLSYSYAYSPLTSLSVTAYGSDLRSELDTRSQDAGGKLQLAHSFSSLLSMTASIGTSQARVNGASGSGVVWDFSLVRRTTQEGQWSFSVRRDVEPNGRGLLINHEEADLSLSRAVAPHLFVTLSATAIRNNDVFIGITFDERRYYAGNAGLEWHPARHWQLDFTGGYSEAIEPQPYQFAHGWRGAMTLRWTPQPWSVSR